MKKLTKIAAVAAVLGASALPLQSANAWWGPGWGGWGPNSGWGDMFGDGSFNMSFSGRGSGNGYGYGYGNPYYGGAPYYGGYPGYYGAPAWGAPGPYAYGPGFAPAPEQKQEKK